jgi:hypothetical protein
MGSNVGTYFNNNMETIMKKISIKEVDAVSWEDKWKKLRKCLELEVTLCDKGIKESLHMTDYYDAARIHEDRATVNWVLDEMENIEIKGECL